MLRKAFAAGQQLVHNKVLWLKYCQQQGRRGMFSSEAQNFFPCKGIGTLAPISMPKWCMANFACTPSPALLFTTRNRFIKRLIRNLIFSASNDLFLISFFWFNWLWIALDSLILWQGHRIKGSFPFPLSIPFLASGFNLKCNFAPEIWNQSSFDSVIDSESIFLEKPSAWSTMQLS